MLYFTCKVIKSTHYIYIGYSKISYRKDGLRLELRIYEVQGLYYLWSENKGAEQRFLSWCIHTGGCQGGLLISEFWPYFYRLANDEGHVLRTAKFYRLPILSPKVYWLLIFNQNFNDFYIYSYALSAVRCSWLLKPGGCDLRKEKGENR